MRVRWLRQALANLNAEADEPWRLLPSAVERLAEYPAMGRPGRVPGTRELIVPDTPYIVPYRVRANTVEVLRVFHAARKWPSAF